MWTSGLQFIFNTVKKQKPDITECIPWSKQTTATIKYVQVMYWIKYTTVQKSSVKWFVC